MTLSPGLPFASPTLLGGEKRAVFNAIAQGHVAAGGAHSRVVEQLIEQALGRPALFVSSCTDALSLAVTALDIGAGDEVIVPGFTFVSTALVVAMRGAVPVFVDIDPRTMTLDPHAVALAITRQTKAVITVHYGGDPGDLDRLRTLTAERGVALVEDAAHCFGGTFRGVALGTIGDAGAFSFDHQKNLQCGEGGALVMKDPALRDRARVLSEKGTNRQAFLEGLVDKYTWVDLGGHHRPPDYVAAALVPQLRERGHIQARRARQWRKYGTGLHDWAVSRGVSMPTERDDVGHSHHIFWLLLPSAEARREFTAWMQEVAIPVPFHYSSLASTPAGERFGRNAGTPVADSVAERLVRLPLYDALTDADIDRVLDRATGWSPSRERLI